MHTHTHTQVHAYNYYPIRVPKMVRNGTKPIKYTATVPVDM